MKTNSLVGKVTTTVLLLFLTVSITSMFVFVFWKSAVGQPLIDQLYLLFLATVVFVFFIYNIIAHGFYQILKETWRS